MINSHEITPPPSGDGENGRITRAAGVVGAATFLSRIFGFLRDMVVAALFGAGVAADAFFVAFRIPNLLRRLFAEGSLTVSFVPVFTEYLETRSKREALELANVVFTALSILLVIVSLAGVLFAPAIVAVMAPGFLKEPGQFALTVMLTRIMFPYILFISLVALCMGILNSLKHFAAPAVSPVLLNISMILSALLLGDLFAEPIYSLAVGVISGGVLQLALQWPFLLKMGMRLRASFNFRHPGLKKIGLLMLPAVFGAAVYQINIFIGTILASLLPPGSVSYLYYADRLVELPLGVFAIAVGTATLPSLSAQASRGDLAGLKNTISFSLRLILFVTLPATVALIALGEPILSVLFERGAFSSLDTLKTNEALFYYALGLWAFSTIRIVVAAFYALQDMKTPMRAAVLALIVNVICSLAFMFPLKHAGLALATSVASAANVLFLSYLLRKRLGSFLDPGFFSACGRMIIASACLYASLNLVEYLLPWNAAGDFGGRLVYLGFSVAAGLGAFLVSARLCRCEELSVILSNFRKRNL